jgi:uncharacterized protein (DUF1778 family)
MRGMKKSKSADLTIRLNSADRETIEAAALADHLPASTWLRQAALRQAAEMRAARKRRVQLNALARSLRGLPRFERGDAD